MSPADLRALRQSMRLSLADLGRAVNRTRLTVWRYEHGVSPIPADVIEAVERLRARHAEATRLEALAAELRRV